MTMTQEEEIIVFSLLAHRMRAKRKANKGESFMSFAKENIKYLKLMKRASPDLYNVEMRILKKI